MTNETAGRTVGVTIRIIGVFRDAWRHIRGVKLPLFGALFVQALVLMVLILANAVLMTAFQHMSPGVILAAQRISSIVQFLVGATLTVGTLNLAVSHLQGKPVRFYQVFYSFRKAHLLSLWGLEIIYLIVNIGLGKWSNYLLIHATSRAVVLPIVAILILESAIAFMMAFAFLLVLRQEHSAWQALRTMLQKVGAQWAKLLLLFILVFVIGIICLIPLFVGLYYFVQLHQMQIGFSTLPWQIQARVVVVCILNFSYIWTLPWLTNVVAVTYRDLFRTGPIAP